jgi:error-prone DNA polymerase
MNACRDAFVESAVRIGRERALAERMYEMIAYFSGYGFCRSHAAAFAKTVYQTAFLKVYYPAEFLAAILSNEPCCFYPAQTVIEEARKWGIRTLPVDINKSEARYSVEKGAIRMGLMQVKGMTEPTADDVVKARGRKPFRSLPDLWQRAPLNRDVVENLIAVGACDSLGTDRRKLLWQLEEVVRTASRGTGPRSRWLLRERGEPVPDLPPLSQLDLASLDFTLQGASAEYSMMTFYRRSLAQAGVLSIGQLWSKAEGTSVRTAGIVISRQRPPTARGMTFLVLADEEGELPAAIAPDVYDVYRHVVNGSASLMVEGVVERERHLISLLIKRVWRLQDVASLDAAPLPAAPAHPALPRPTVPA